MARQQSSGNASNNGRPATAGATGTTRRRSLSIPVVGGLAVIALLAATVAFARPAATPVAAACTLAGATGLGVGECAPGFTLSDVRGRPVTLASFRGHPVLLHFWAVGCTSCAAEYPDFARAVAAYMPHGVHVVAVDAWGEPSTLVRQWQTSHTVAGTFLVDRPQGVVRQYGVQGTPTTLFIDKQGRITGRGTGPLAYADFDQALTHLISL